MVDYSKWNSFCDSDDDDNEMDFTQPAVTQLDKNSRVTIGPQGVNYTDTPVSSPSPSTSNFSSNVVKAATGENSVLTTIIRNGGRAKEFCWSQSRTDVVVHIVLPANTVASKLKVVILGKNIGISIDGSEYLSRSLQFPFLEFDKDNDSAVDWEIVRISNVFVSGDNVTFLKLTFQKKSPIPNATQWWSRIFVEGSRTVGEKVDSNVDGDRWEEEDIDVTQIADRNSSSAISSKGENSLNSAWMKAHEKFTQDRIAEQESGVDTRTEV